MKMTEAAVRVFEYLKVHARGKRNTIPIRVIVKNLNLSRRIVERATEAIRELQDEVLCSETKVAHGAGLYLAESPEEVTQYYYQLDSRVRKICIHKALIRKAAYAKFSDKVGAQMNWLNEVAA